MNNSEIQLKKKKKMNQKSLTEWHLQSKKELSQDIKTYDNSLKRPLHNAALAALLSTFRLGHLHE